MRTGQDGGLLPRRSPRPGEFVTEVPSFTTPGVTYLVRQSLDGSWDCNCPDAVCRQRECKHIAAVRCTYPPRPRRGDLL